MLGGPELYSNELQGHGWVEDQGNNVLLGWRENSLRPDLGMSSEHATGALRSEMSFRP